MKSEIIKRTMYGIACGGIYTYIALTILMFNQINPSITIIWLYTGGGFVLGIYFALSSFIFEIKNWSPLKKTIIHFAGSISTYFIIALPLKWVPLTPIAILIATCMFITLYAIYWFGFWIYHKRIEVRLNKELKKETIKHD